MKKRLPAGARSLALLLLALCTLAVPFGLPEAASADEALELAALPDDEAVVRTDDLEEGVTGVTGKIRIHARPEEVWSVITDYDNHEEFIPKIVESRLLSDTGTEQVLFQTGKSGVLFFRKTVRIKLRVRSEPFSRIGFRILEGDFKIYHGEWRLEPLPEGDSSLLTFRATIKPDFFAPSFFVRSVQKNDLPGILEAVKERAESLHPRN